MNQSYGFAADDGSSQSTSLYVARVDAPGVPKAACRLVNLVAGSSSHRTGEMVPLLRNRLRATAVIALGAFTIFLGRTLLVGLNQIDVLVLPFHVFMIAAIAVLAGILWSRLRLCVFHLRLIELALFGGCAAFFAWMEVAWFWSEQLPRFLNHSVSSSSLSLAAASMVFPWFMLVVLYGTFIPNTWRRCAIVVAILTLTPLAITTVAVLVSRSIGVNLLPLILFEMALRLAIAAAVAIYGSYRIHVLREQAFEARQLGQYRLKERLGEGGMGEVYLAEHQLLRRPCAIKVIRPENAGDPQSLLRFEREVQVMASLTHWNTVEVYDYGHTSDGTFYYVMEYLPGMSLEDMIEQHGPLPPDRVVHFLRQVCAALNEAHAIGLIHRDIKPSNVIACERGGVFDVVKLLDFGIVTVSAGKNKRSMRITSEGAVVGTPLFMSPEQATGKGMVDGRSDIYSVGAMAYFLLTGQPPFVRESPIEVLAAHLKEPVPRLTDLRPDLPFDVQDIVLRCLEKDPEHRFPDAASLGKALAECKCATRWTPERAETWWAEHAAQHRRRIPCARKQMAEVAGV